MFEMAFDEYAEHLQSESDGRLQGGTTEKVSQSVFAEALGACIPTATSFTARHELNRFLDPTIYPCHDPDNPLEWYKACLSLTLPPTLAHAFF